MVTPEELSSATSIEQEIRHRLTPVGLLPLGWFDAEGAAALLIGNAGSSLWPAFSVSDELADGRPDPLNRWTEATISELVDQLPDQLVHEVRYPFGEPIWPFQEYARHAMGIKQSPIGLLHHPEFGLWTAFRAALVFGGQFPFPASRPRSHACDDCRARPCLNTCPIGAFASDGYDYSACKSHVASNAGRACFESGCLARQACPIGHDHAYEKTHQAFHMKAYV
ncbi:MAG: ferredoxin [Rhizobiaceae bacterium]